MALPEVKIVLSQASRGDYSPLAAVFAAASSDYSAENKKYIKKLLNAYVPYPPDDEEDEEEEEDGEEDGEEDDEEEEDESQEFSGDKLVHFLAYASVESSVPASSPTSPLSLLTSLLSLDRFASHKLSDDGGSALHCALVAGLDMLTVEPSDSSPLVSDCTSRLHATLAVLLGASAPPDCHLTAPPRPPSDGENGGAEDDDYGDEVFPPAFPPQAYREGWTPLVFALHYCALASLHLGFSSPSLTSSPSFAPVSIVSLLLRSGADSSLPVQAGRRPVEYLCACAPVLTAADARELAALLAAADRCASDDDKESSRTFRILQLPNDKADVEAFLESEFKNDGGNGTSNGVRRTLFGALAPEDRLPELALIYGPPDHTPKSAFNVLCSRLEVAKITTLLGCIVKDEGKKKAEKLPPYPPPPPQLLSFIDSLFDNSGLFSLRMNEASGSSNRALAISSATSILSLILSLSPSSPVVISRPLPPPSPSIPSPPKTALTLPFLECALAHALSRPYAALSDVAPVLSSCFLASLQSPSATPSSSLPPPPPASRLPSPQLSLLSGLVRSCRTAPSVMWTYVDGLLLSLYGFESLHFKDAYGSPVGFAPSLPLDECLASGFHAGAVGLFRRYLGEAARREKEGWGGWALEEARTYESEERAKGVARAACEVGDFEMLHRCAANKLASGGDFWGEILNRCLDGRSGVGRCKNEDEVRQLAGLVKVELGEELRAVVVFDKMSGFGPLHYLTVDERVGGSDVTNALKDLLLQDLLSFYERCGADPKAKCKPEFGAWAFGDKR